MVVRFGEFELDRERYELRRSGTPLAVEPQVFEVLAHLVRHRDRVVTRSELLEAVWEGRLVSDSAVSRAIREVRRVLGDSGAESRWVKTIYGRGFSFVGPVSEPEEPPGEVAAPPAGRRAAPAPLPAPLTPLIGRERELEETARLLETTRLLTLTGAAGAGKSRLALAVAARVAGRFPDGVALVPLAEVATPDLAARAVLRALGAGDAAGATPLESLELHLREARVLLVLDDFEQLVGTPHRLAELLRRCPGVVALVTSRFVLRVEGEQEYPLSPLELPARGAGAAAIETAPAVALFLERARSVLPGFRPDRDELGYVAETCRRLDGLPLAIELAAARVKLLPPRALWERLASRLDLLSSPGRSRESPRRTLEQALAWSYDLLEEDERELLRRLAVFARGFSLEAAEQVCGPRGEALVDRLAGLVDKSLVERQTPVAGEPRFRLLETTRRFARDRLEASGEAPARRTAHALWALRLARAAEPALAGGDQKTWLDRLDADYANLLSALEWARSGGDLAVGVATGAALGRYWSARGAYREGRAELTALLDAPGAEALDAGLRADGLVALGLLTHLLCEFRRAGEILGEARALLRDGDDPTRRAQLLDHLAWVALVLGRLAEAEATAREALALHEERAEKRGLAVALNNLGWVEMYRGDARRAEAHLSGSLARRREAGDERGEAFALANLVVMSLVLGGDPEGLDGRLAEARRLVDRLADPPLQDWVTFAEAALRLRQGDADGALERLEALARERRERLQPEAAAWVLLWRGEAHRERGEVAAARERMQESLELWQALEVPWGVATALSRLGSLHAGEGDSATAAELYRRALELCERHGFAALGAACREGLAGR